MSSVLRHCVRSYLPLLVILPLSAIIGFSQSAPPPPSLPPQQPAPAQSAPSIAASAADKGEEVVNLDAVMVTGTNIRGIAGETVLPVSTLDLEELSARAASTAAELLETLPGGGLMDLNEANVLGADARGDNASINLRGIGSGNTLVLLNGRRLAPHPMSQAENGVPSLSVNANQLPIFAASRIEVLRDGSSAIYGSDAAAGVVNTVVRAEGRANSISTRIGVSQNRGGGEWRSTLQFGKLINQGRTHVSLSFDYYHRQLLRASDRWWSADTDLRPRAPAPWNGQPLVDATGAIVRDNDMDNSSSASNYGQFIRGSWDANGSFAGARPDGNRGITTSTTPSTVAKMTTAGIFYMSPLADGSTGFRTTAPSRNIDGVEHPYFYNLNQHRVHLPKTNRGTLFTQLEHHFANGLVARGEFFLYDARSTTLRDPCALDSQDDLNIYIGAQNPYNPFGVRFYHPTGAPNADGTPRLVGTPADVLIAPSTGVRPREFRERIVHIQSRSYRAVGELKGKAWGDFEWLYGLGYSTSITRDEEDFNVRDSRTRAALLRSDASALNPFGYTFRIDPASNQIVVDKPYVNPASTIDPLYDTFIREGRTELAFTDFKIDGRLLEIRGIPVRTAFGAEYRFETYKDWRPPYAGLNPLDDPDPLVAKGDNDYVGLSPNVNIYADRSVASAFAETFIPIVGKRNRIKGIEALDLSAAVRSERYSHASTATKPKIALGYRPLRQWLLRGSYNESFRAPNLVQTNTTPLQRSVTGISDPYRSEVTNLLIDGSSTRTVFRKGNDLLRPESAKSWTLGIAGEVPRLKGFTVTFDYYHTRQRDVIDNVTAADTLLRDEQLLDQEVQRQLAAGTAIGNVNLGSGTGEYKGDALVKRAQLTPADVTFYNTYNATRPPAQQRAPVGRVVSITEDYLNLAGREVEGFEASLQYLLPKNPLGQITLRAEVNRRIRYQTQADSESPVESYLEENGRPKWRGNASLSWRRGAWSASWFANYWGESVDTGASTTAAVYEALGRPKYIRNYLNDGLQRYYLRIAPSLTHNVHLGYTFPRSAPYRLDGLRLRIGMNNIANKEPPLADETRGTIGGSVSPRGRVSYLELSKRF